MKGWTFCCFVIIITSKFPTRGAILKFCLKQSKSSASEDIDTAKYELPRWDVVKELARRLELLQVKRDRPYRFPLTWQQDKGLYPSDIRLNLAGPPHLAMVRDDLYVFDNNMFATAWVTVCLLEAHYYAQAPRPTDSQLRLTLEAVGRYHDKNLGFDNSVMNFWPQVYNASTGMWESTPTNMLKAFDVFDVIPVKLIEDILQMLGLTDLEHFLKSILSMRSTFERAFHIPPDFDDTFMNLGFGALLKDLGKELPDALAQWTAQNTNVTSVVDALRQYAYRPFSSNQNVNTVDTRTYYYLRHFLNEAKAKNEDIALVPTWVQNLDEARKDYNRGVAMPFQMNNVDVSVAANSVYGLTAAVLSDVLPSSVLDDPLVRQVYLNTSSMIASEISHQLYQRPDLELTYYPSVFEFYWFTARTLARLQTARLKASLPSALEDVYQTLKPVLEQVMTDDITGKAKPLGHDMLFLDDFLGDGDVDDFNRTLVRGEDRLFTTSVAVNALLSTWTLFNEVSRNISWKRHAPAEVRHTVEKLVKFLTTYILRDSFTGYRPWNVFFSGSSKGRSTMPFGYPANRIEYLNGTVIHDDTHFPEGGPFFFGVQGIIPEWQYKELIQHKHFGMKTPTTFTSYNQPDNYFPFWSSSAYTYANTLLALSRFEHIHCAAMNLCNS